MKKTILFIAILIMASVASGKVVRRTLSLFQNKVPESEIISPETMEFVYDFSWCTDTTETLEENYTSDQMLLQIAPSGLSKFSSYKNLTVDSILMNMTKDQLDEAAINGKLSNGEFMTIFKNYPEGKLTHTEKICMDWLRYEEDMPQMKWQLTYDSTTVLGYECRSAKCSFRGREWTVYYCEEIPVMDGPWKLHGLPGLIMKASDESHQYLFECIGIKSGADRPITIYKVPYNDTGRRKYYDTKHRFDINPFAYYEATGNGKITMMDEAGNPVLDGYEPIELPYDYIEKDWRK